MQTSNIAQPTGTDAAFAWPRWLPAGIVAALVYVGFRPFAEASAATGGDIVNQIGFAAIGAGCIYLISQMDRAARAALLQPAWIAVGLLLIFSTLMADSPGGAFRAAIFSAIVVLAAGTALAWPRSRTEFTGQLAFVAMAALALSFVAVFVYPSVGVHGSGGFEPQHWGLWRGVYAHKNVAGYVAGAFVIVGLFLTFNGRVGWGIAVTLLALIFTVEAGSKTVLGVLPVAIGTAWLASRFENGLMRGLIILTPLAALLTATVGAAFVPGIDDTLQAIAPGTTYTGRIDLWRFTAEQIAKAPHTGFGFESFWGTSRVTGLEQPIELSWDVRRIVHGHNSYLDAIVTFGIWGAIVLFWVLLARPLYHFALLPKARAGMPGALAQLYISLWLLCALGACLESFFLRRSDPVWFTMAIGIFGLQITASRSRSLRAP